MSEKEIAFLDEVDKRFRNQKSWYSSIIVGLIIGVIALGGTIISGTSANKENIRQLTEDVVDIKLYYVDVFMFRELMSSFQLYTDHITAIMGGDPTELKSVNERYDKLWNAILFDPKISATRGGSGDNNGTE